MRRAAAVTLLALTACAPQTEYVRANSPPLALQTRSVDGGRGHAQLPTSGLRRPVP